MRWYTILLPLILNPEMKFCTILFDLFVGNTWTRIPFNRQWFLFSSQDFSFFRRINFRPRSDYPLDVRLRHQQPVINKISLRCLSLRGYKKVTDKSLFYLNHLNLELLDLTYTSVTKAGIEEFLLGNPNCRIIHHNYCRCMPKNPF